MEKKDGCYYKVREHEENEMSKNRMLISNPQEQMECKELTLKIIILQTKEYLFYVTPWLEALLE